MPKPTRVMLKLNMDDVRKAAAGELDEAMYAGGEEILQAAIPKAPMASGELRDSGYVATAGKTSYRPGKLRNKAPKVGKGEAIVGFSAFYARFLEYGTVRMPARPFLRPAFDERRERALKIIAERLRRAMEDA